LRRRSVIHCAEDAVEATHAPKTRLERDFGDLERRSVEKSFRALKSPRPGNGAWRCATMLDEESGQMALADTEDVSQLRDSVLVEKALIDERHATRDGRA
jgi:hypothetical protein